MHKEESLLRRSLLNRVRTRFLQKDGVAKHKEKVYRLTSDQSQASERPRPLSMPSEAELRRYLGPVDECLVEKAEIAKRRRRGVATNGRPHSIQLNSADLRTHNSETQSLPRNFRPKPARYNFVRCKWCEPIEVPVIVEPDDSNDETYIDENGIYTTVLCFTEI